MSLADPSQSTPKSKLSFLLRIVRVALGQFIALGIVIGFFGVADGLQADGGKFFTSENFRAISAQTATVAVAALGMTVIVIAGGIDLSAGTTLALCATVLAWCLKEDAAMLIVHGDSVAGAEHRLEELEDRLERIPRDIAREKRAKVSDPAVVEQLLAEQVELKLKLPKQQEHLLAMQAASPEITPYTPTLALTAGMLTGCLAGFVNGFLVSYLRVVPFIVTLGTMRLYLGIAKEVAEETTVRPDQATQIPNWLFEFLSLREHALWGWFPLGVWLILVFAVILAAVLRFTVFGRHVFALGSNESTARLCGIHVERNKIALYTLGGFFFGIAGVYQFSQLSVGNPTSGIGMELSIIAAVVIGGGSLSGGRGSVIGTLLGATIMAVITSGCTQLGLKNPVQDMILGGIIIAAVAVDQIQQRRSRK